MWKLRKHNRENVVYAPLQQTFSDDDDFEDEILFDQDLTISSASRNGSKRFGRDVIELENLQGSRLKLRDRRRSEIAVRSGWLLTKKFCVILTIIILIVSAICAGVLFPRYFFHSHFLAPSTEWSLSFGNYVSDSCIRLVDVDNDGQLDIILSLATPDYNHHYHSSMGMDKQQQLNESCRKKGLSYPCAGQLLAIRGYDGKQLWQLSTKSSILYIHCDQLDADQDGLHDCLISGYHATLQAVDPRKGAVIWSADTKYLIDHWNIYQALVVPDVDQDNVDDVLILHGGCCYYGNSSPPANAGRFLLFSGATGHTLGTFVNITIMKGGVYRNPVLYKSSNTTLNVLFGSGQLASSGGLHQIYWDVLKKQLLDPQVELLSNTKTIDRSLTKGILVPPVIVDVHDDGVMDILMSAFDGNLTLYDGRTFKAKWKINFDGYESLSIPAPGYFNNDAYLDFMMHLNYGTWPTYAYSMVVVVSGKDGAVLWKMASSFPSFTSDLTLQMVEHQRDVFVFKTFGREGPVYVDSKGNLNGVTDGTLSTKQPEYHSTPGIQSSDEYPGGYFRVCTLDIQSSLTEEVFIMDRSNMDKPILLAKNEYFPFPSSSFAQRLCVIMKPLGRGTGAIGDVDGDDQPDYISLTNLATVEYSPVAKDSDIWQNVTLHKKALTSAVRSSTQVPLKIFSSLLNGGRGGGENDGDSERHDRGLESTEFVPQREQVWSEYFGCKQTGVYRRQHLSDGGNTMSRRSRVLYYLVVLFTLLVVLL